MATCVGKFEVMFTQEIQPVRLLSTINRLTEWAVVHPYGSFAFTEFLDQYLPSNIVNEGLNLLFLAFSSFFGCVVWEIIEFVLFLLGWTWFDESVYKKMFDILEDSIGISIYILIKYMLGLIKWRHTSKTEKLPSAIAQILQFISAMFSCLFYIRNICLPFNVGGFQYFYNTVPVGYYIFIVTMTFLIYINVKRAIAVFPENEVYIKQKMILNYTYFFALTIPNVLWSWSIYATTWVAASIVAFFFYFNRGSIKDHLDAAYSAKFSKIEKEEDIEDYEDGLVDTI